MRGCGVCVRRADGEQAQPPLVRDGAGDCQQRSIRGPGQLPPGKAAAEAFFPREMGFAGGGIQQEELRALEAVGGDFDDAQNRQPAAIGRPGDIGEQGGRILPGERLPAAGVPDLQPGAADGRAGLRSRREEGGALCAIGAPLCVEQRDLRGIAGVRCGGRGVAPGAARIRGGRRLVLARRWIEVRGLHAVVLGKIQCQGQSPIGFPAGNADGMGMGQGRIGCAEGGRGIRSGDSRLTARQHP